MCNEQKKDFILGEADANGAKDDEEEEEEEGQCSGTVGVEICRFNLPPCAAAEAARILPLPSPLLCLSERR